MSHNHFRIVGKPTLHRRNGLLFLGALREASLISLVVGLVLVVLCQTSFVNTQHSSPKNQFLEPCHSGSVRHLDFDRDRQSLHVYSWPNHFDEIDLQSGIVSKRLSPWNLVSIATSERNSTTAMLSQQTDATIVRPVVYISRQNELLLTEEIAGGNRTSADVRISADGSIVLLVGHEGSVIGWDLSSIEPIRWEFQLNHSAFINLLSPDGRWLFAAATVGDSAIYDARTGTAKMTIPAIGRSKNSAAWASNGDRLAIADHNGDLSVFETTTGTLIWRDKLHLMFAQSIALSMDGNLLVTGGFDKTIRIWDLSQSAHSPIILNGDSGLVHEFVFISNSTFISGSDDGRIFEWSLATRKLIRQLR